MPIRGPTAISTASAARANSSNGRVHQGEAICASVMPSASHSRPGPEHKQPFLGQRRAAAHRGKPVRRLAARGSDTALALPSGSHTKLTHQ